MHIYIYVLFFPIVQHKTDWKKYMYFPLGKKLMTFKSLEVQVPAVES